MRSVVEKVNENAISTEIAYMWFLVIRLHIRRNKIYYQFQRKVVANLIRREVYEDQNKLARPAIRYPGNIAGGHINMAGNIAGHMTGRLPQAARGCRNIAGPTAIWPAIWPDCELSI